MATQLAERRVHPVEAFRQALDHRTNEIKMALPSHISVDKFRRVATTAVQTNPDLLDGNKVERASLFTALVRAAQDGLLPDGREGAIVPFKGKAQWMPMVAGIMQKVRRSGEVASWDVAAVYEKDQFERLLGDDQRIFHKPYEEGDPGKVIGAYSIVTFKDGTKSRDYMPKWRIDKAKNQGRGASSLMWTTFEDEGAIKTVIRHHAKRLPQATDIEAMFERDETMAVEHQPHAPVQEAQPEPAHNLSRLDALEQAIDTTPLDPNAGEKRGDEDMGENVDA